MSGSDGEADAFWALGKRALGFGLGGSGFAGDVDAFLFTGGAEEGIEERVVGGVFQGGAVVYIRLGLK